MKLVGIEAIEASVFHVDKIIRAFAEITITDSKPRQDPYRSFGAVFRVPIDRPGYVPEEMQP